MSCIDSKTGVVEKNKVPAMKNWNRNTGIEKVLQSIRMEMCSDKNRRLKQPAEGATFWEEEEDAKHIIIIAVILFFKKKQYSHCIIVIFRKKIRFCYGCVT